MIKPFLKLWTPGQASKARARDLSTLLEERADTTANVPVLHMASPTHYAGLMIRLMVAHRLRQSIPDLAISAMDLPYWGIRHPVLDRRGTERVCRIVSEQHFDFVQIAYYADRGLCRRFEWFGYGQRLDNFPDKDVCRQMFRCDQSIGTETRDDTIVCPIRGAEILDAIHPGYTSVPVDFYEDIVAATGLKPVFLGQLEPNAYTDRIRERFPKATFLAHKSPIEDFQTIRKAHNIVVSISTFSWLAAWLSEAKTIVMPVFGLFDPRSFPGHDLLPLSEPSFRFFLFPEQAAVPLSQLWAAHERIKGQWVEVSGDTLVREAIGG